MRKFRNGIARAIAVGLVSGLALAAGLAGDAAAEETHRWKMASTFPGSFPLLGSGGKQLADTITEATADAVKVRFYDPGALVPPFEVFDAVSKGSVDAGWSTPGYWVGKIPAAALFSSVPFGMRTDEMLSWYKNGGGKEAFEALYEPHNIKPLVCAILPPEGGGWFRKEIASVDDLKGLNMRIGGTPALALEKLGVSTQMIAGGELYQALELGTIDAAEFSMPSVDATAGFHEVASYYYFPGWHQPATILELLINKDRWNALSDLQRRQVEIACDATIAQIIAEAEASQVAALREIESKGAKIVRLPDEVQKALGDAWLAVAAEMSEQDPQFREIWTGMNDFRKTYARWNEIQKMEPRIAD